MSTPMKVSARRGSQSAPDPFNVHADLNLNPNRACSSTITIVRVSPEQNQHQRSPSHGHRTSQHPAPTRLSFAFSSFSGPSSPTTTTTTTTGGGTPASPTSSPRLRPSPFITYGGHTHHNLGGGKPRFTPDQIIDLARQAASPNSGGSNAPAPPATFTPLPDDVYLPFLDRPSEVSALISSPPDVKLFTLLAQTFPPESRSIPVADPSSSQPSTLPPNPIHWTYPQLIHHLTKIDRSTVPDFLWTVAARKCIFAHSELIWERIKGALGVPPELDVDVEFIEGDNSREEEGRVSGAGEERSEDRKEDWEQAILDSPICIKSPLRDRFGDALERYTTAEERLLDEEGGSDGDDGMISIEPLLSSPTPTSTLPSAGGGLGLGLGDIAEGAEDEDEDEDEAQKNDKTEEEDPHALIASKIQGLRISTSPLSLSGTPAATSPHISSSPPHPSDSPRLRAHSRTSSYSSLTGIGPFHRSESTGSLAALWSAARQEGVFVSSSSVGGGSESGFAGAGEEEGELGMGPRFPANFARLGRGRGSGQKVPSQVRKRVAYVSSSSASVGMEETKKARAFSYGSNSTMQMPIGLERRKSWGLGKSG